jgi:hypothetical protein
LPRDYEERIGAISVQRSSSSAQEPFATLHGELPLGVTMSYVDNSVSTGATYWYRLVVRAKNDHTEHASAAIQAMVPRESDLVTAIASVRMSNRGEIMIAYEVGPNTTHVALRIFDVRGRLVRTIDAGDRSPGRYLKNWDRTTDQGGRTSYGVYLARLRTPSSHSAKKFVVRP